MPTSLGAGMAEREIHMATHTLDAKGLRCPQPVIEMTAMVPKLSKGDLLEVTADCDTFEDDVRKWCVRWNSTLLAITYDGDVASAQIQF
jgi:tRNA 2-thiouridine synthesizing protein A